MLWLDSSYPPEKAGQPGGDRGPCEQSSGVPSEVESKLASSKVTYSNIRFGPIGSTVNV
jgi:cellulose 1,4-beta-cellobiosidase